MLHTLVPIVFEHPPTGRSPPDRDDRAGHRVREIVMRAGRVTSRSLFATTLQPLRYFTSGSSANYLISLEPPAGIEPATY